MQSSCLDSLNLLLCSLFRCQRRQGKAVLRAFQDTDVKGVMLSLVTDDCQ